MSLFRAPDRPAATSASPRWPLVAFLAVAAAFYVGRGGCSAPAPAPPRPDGPDLVAAFATNDNRAAARSHARMFATICTSLADYVEYDGTRSEPLIRTGVQMDELRWSLRQTRTRGWSFLTQYPGLKTPLEEFLAAQLGTSGGPIDAAQRAKWISAMRTLAAAADYAANRG